MRTCCGPGEMPRACSRTLTRMETCNALSCPSSWRLHDAANVVCLVCRHLDQEEFEVGMKRLGVSLRPAETTALMEVSRVSRARSAPLVYDCALQAFDDDGSGHLSLVEFLKALKKA